MIPLHFHTCAHMADGSGFMDETVTGGTIVRCLDGQFTGWPCGFHSDGPLTT